MKKQVPWTLHGDETGLIKEIHYSHEGVGKAHSIVGVQNRELGIDRFCVMGEYNVAVATKNSSCQQWNGSDLIPVVPQLNKGSRIRALCGKDDRLVSCSENGVIQVRTWPTGAVVLDHFQAHPSSIEGASMLDAVIGFGGKKCDLKLWNVESQQFAFQARNVPNDSLDMEVPIWITDVGFSASTPNLVFTSTAFGDIRAYDTRQQRRPIKNIRVKASGDGIQDGINYHFNCLKVTPEDQVVVADIFGNVTLVDVLNTGRMVARFKGNKGSVRALDIDPVSRSLVCGGVDRVIRVFELDSRKERSRCYVKQKINAVAIGACFPVVANEEDSEDEGWSEESENEETDEDVTESKRLKTDQ